jgi:hypothetical protein
MKQDKKKISVIKNSLSQQEMEEVEERFLDEKNPLLSLAVALEQSKGAKLSKSASSSFPSPRR